MLKNGTRSSPKASSSRTSRRPLAHVEHNPFPSPLAATRRPCVPPIPLPSERRTDAGYILRPRNADTVGHYFDSDYLSVGQAGIIRGAHHIADIRARFNDSTQAKYFIDRGGRWVHDGITLPGAVIFEGILSTRAHGVPCPRIS